MMHRLFTTAISSVLLFSSAAIAANGVTPEKVVFGQTTNLSAPATLETSKAFIAGWDLVLNRVNAAGGIHGRKIETLRVDDGYEPQKAVLAVKAMLEKDQVLALIGEFGSAIATALLPMVDQFNVPFVTPSTGIDLLSNPVNKNVFMARSRASDEAKGLIEFIVQNQNAKEIGVLYQDDAFGDSGRLAILKALAERGLKPVVTASYRRNSDELAAAIDQIKKANPTAVVLWATYKPAATFIKEAAKKDFHPRLFGPSNIATEEFLKETGALAEGVHTALILPLVTDTSFKVVQDYQRDAKTAKVSMSGFGLIGYIDGLILVEALKLAGPNLTRASLRAGFEQIKQFDIGGLKVSYSPTNHIGISEFYMSLVKDGKFVSVK